MRMKSGEPVQDFISRILDVVYQVRTLGDTLTEQAVVSKILRSLTPKFNHVVSSIIEARNLTTLSVDELSGSLEGHESILNLSENQVEEKAFQIRFETAAPCEDSTSGGRGRGHGSFRARARGRGMGRSPDLRSTHGDFRQNRAGVQCYICKRFEHMKAQCWYKNKGANVVEDI